MVLVQAKKLHRDLLSKEHDKKALFFRLPFSYLLWTVGARWTSQTMFELRLSLS
jgi:hypothetical protein